MNQTRKEKDLSILLDDGVCFVLGRVSYSIQHGDKQETGKDWWLRILLHCEAESWAVS